MTIGAMIMFASGEKDDGHTHEDHGGEHGGGALTFKA